MNKLCKAWSWPTFYLLGLNIFVNNCRNYISHISVGCWMSSFPSVTKTPITMWVHISGSKLPIMVCLSRLFWSEVLHTAVIDHSLCHCPKLAKTCPDTAIDGLIGHAINMAACIASCWNVTVLWEKRQTLVECMVPTTGCTKEAMYVWCDTWWQQWAIWSNALQHITANLGGRVPYKRSIW